MPFIIKKNSDELALLQVPSISETLYNTLGFGSSVDLQLIENNNINNNAIKDIILGIELNNIFTVNFAIFHFCLQKFN